MRLSSVRIENFRCLRNLEINLDSVTVLVGANGTGKSSVLHALRWFFFGGAIDERDITGHEPGLTVSVTSTFHDFTEEDRVALGKYAQGDTATFERRWSAEDGEKLTGRSRAYPPFEAVRAQETATEKRAGYSQLRSDQPELGLPTANSAQAALEAMDEWEGAHPDDLESASVSATHLFGATGGARVAGRFDYVLIPAAADLEREARDERGTLLRQLLDRFVVNRPELRERLGEIAVEAAARVNEIMDEEAKEDLASLAGDLTVELERLVPETKVTLRPLPVDVPVPSPSVGLSVSDTGLETDLALQGHGVQRSLFMAMVQRLATPSKHVNGTAADTSPSRLLLAIEEPELFQHPLQARHLSGTLSRLAEGDGGIQVIYATHSEHFVDARSFPRIRRFQRTGDGPAVSAITQATLERVANRLEGVVPRAEIETRVRITLGRSLAEAVFARAAVIVEGRTDAGFLYGLAERSGGLDIRGTAVVRAGGKNQLLLPWAVLEELGVPTFLIFDGDAGLADRLLAQGQSEDDASHKQDQSRETNAEILRILGYDPDPQPATTVEERFACFSDELETEWHSWPGFEDELKRVAEDLADFRLKSEDAYLLAARQAPDPVPDLFVRLVAAIEALVPA